MQIISRSILFATFTALAAGSAGCTRTQKNVEVAKRDATATNPVVNGSGVNNPVIKPGTASATAVIDFRGHETLTRDTDTFSYKFEYIDFKEEKALTLADGKATIQLSNLPAEKSGEVKLVILKNSTVFAQGTAANVALKANQDNNIAIELTKVDTGTVVGPGTTNATITVSLPGQPVVVANPGSGTNPVTNPDLNPAPVIPNVPNPTPPSWDGLADRGNEKWMVETITP